MKDFKKEPDLFDKLTNYAQIVVGVLALLFALYTLISLIVKGSSWVYITAFAVMMVAAYALIEVSVEELRGER